MEPQARILVVDCDERALDSAVGLLRSTAYAVTGAGTFEAARRLLNANQYDLIITTLRLLPYNGLHLVIHSQTLHPETRAIVLADPPDAGSDVEARRLGAHCLRTPVDPDRLLAFVRTILDGRAPRPVRRSRQAAY